MDAKSLRKHLNDICTKIDVGKIATGALVASLLVTGGCAAGDKDVNVDATEDGVAGSGGASGGSGGTGGASGGNVGSGGNGSSGGSGSSGSCDINGFTMMQDLSDEDSDALIYEAYDSATDPTNVLDLELYYGDGASSQPHTFTAWENYASCHTCALFYWGCDATNGCQKIFEVYSGTLTVSVNENGDKVGAFTGALTDIKAREVTIDPSTYQSTVVPNGETLCVSNYSFDVTTVTP